MNTKPYLSVSGFIFFAVGLFHLLRLLSHGGCPSGRIACSVGDGVWARGNDHRFNTDV